MVSAFRNAIDPNTKVSVRYVNSSRDGRWRWTAYEGNKCVCLGPVRGYDTYTEAVKAANDLLNVR